MFGYLQADRRLLTEAEDLRYRSAYCGLCRSMRQRYGQFSGVVLNYDFAFLVLLLQALYETEERAGANLCLRHPRAPTPWLTCGFTDYAADMNIALGYLKLQDDWQDDGKLLSLGASRALQKAYRLIQQRYPRQCGVMEISVNNLRLLERENTEDPDAAAQTCAEFMAEIFAVWDDRWADCLRELGASLGRFIYVADAVADLNRDVFWNHYNPFRRYYGCSDNEERFREMLKMLLGECLYWFDLLPIVSDTGILKNILCYGLWTAFNRSFSTETKEKDGNE